MFEEGKLCIRRLTVVHVNVGVENIADLPALPFRQGDLPVFVNFSHSPGKGIKSPPFQQVFPVKAPCLNNSLKPNLSA